MILTSPVKRFSGTVEIPDALTFPEYVAWENGFTGMSGESYTVTAQALLPAICMIVKGWKLDNFPEKVTPDTFPATPPAAVAQLLAWLVGEILRVVEGSDDPNA